MLRINSILAATVAAFALTGAPALAQTDANSTKACPPGLAKKDPACVPPGQVGKSWVEGQVYAEGDRIRGEYRVIPPEEWEELSLDPITDDSVYVIIDNQILRIKESNLTVIAAIRILEEPDDSGDPVDDPADDPADDAGDDGSDDSDDDATVTE